MAEEEKQKRSTRIDVQVKLNKMIDMMKRPQGASVKELCLELECSPKTFYRNLDKLSAEDVPFITRPDPNEATNSVRYYILKEGVRGSNVFLTSSEKAILRMMIQSTEPMFAKYNDHQEEAKVLLEKLNDGIIHDIKNTEYKYIPDPFTTMQKWEYDENFYLLSQALDLKQSISFKTGGRSDVKFEEEFIPFEDKTFFQVYTIANKQGIFYAFGKVVPVEPLPENVKLPAEIRCQKINNFDKIQFQKKYVYSIPEDYDFDYWDNFYFPRGKKTSVHLAMDEKTMHTVLHCCEYYPKTFYDFGGKTHIVIETDDLESLKKYVLGFGTGMQVIAPESFANAVKAELKKMMEFYEPQKELEFYTETVEVHAPEKSFDKHSWESSNWVDILLHWWRIDIEGPDDVFGKYLNYNLFTFNEPGLQKIIEAEQHIYTFNSTYLDEFKKKGDIKSPCKIIFYEEYIAFEFPFPDKIDGDIDFLLPLLNDIANFIPSEKYVKYILSFCKDLSKSTRKYVLDNLDKYTSHKIFVLWTGMNYIKPEWAKEIHDKGTLCGITSKAIVLRGTGDTKGNMDVTVYKFSKAGEDKEL